MPSRPLHQRYVAATVRWCSRRGRLSVAVREDLAMADAPLDLSSSPGETVLPAPPTGAVEALSAALGLDPADRRQAVAEVVAGHPSFLEGWASLGDLARDDLEAYACYRVGYHRGLDALRAAGWRGSGYVRSVHPSNRGFLRSLEGLRRAAGAIGETDEEERCRLFLAQLDPGGQDVGS